MNQLEILEFLDKLLSKTESAIERVFGLRLKSILFQINDMYRKYEKNGELSYTELNKYNRFQKEMELIGKALTDDYKEIIKLINGSLEMQYTENYLRHAYLFQLGLSVDMGFTLPSMSVIQGAIKNPIDKLTLPAVLQEHRNEIVRKINIEISQSLIAGEGYSTMAKRIENAVGFSQKKARAVARTETGRVRSLSDEAVSEQAAKYAKMDKVWASSLDLRVRTSHRELDGQKADKNGYFHYKGLKAKGPHLWGRANMDINCRCTTLHLVNGKFPEYRRGRDYMDAEYQKKLADRIDDLMADEGLTYIQALKKAQKAIKPPSTTMPYVTFEDWKKKFAS
ncbi:phage minor head protein [Cytobacillus firmus]|uniref:phage minor head protein n=1 Tax=Cytobacillus firmus TaxID=1399 RepID=UPI0018CDDCA9|nr:phage minor head protein [Cytobacillus firmus]MBG9549759.1 phage minor head protein [Cytobacillus firmus]MBG9603119.1 phage minor head protein [Cytobacillus firmus]MED1942087.1 phage minor head protein [Cytobacillus firmus]